MITEKQAYNAILHHVENAIDELGDALREAEKHKVEEFDLGDCKRAAWQLREKIQGVMRG